MSEGETRPLVVGITGASGAALGVRTLEACKELGVAHARFERWARSPPGSPLRS
jgi:3-polyprenyl-4-hydroxybenzoate decarboxylase